MYAKEFDLEQYIKLNSKVERLSKSDDHTETGRWNVRYTRFVNKQLKMITCDCDNSVAFL
jgi:hypothetical protein